MTDSALYAVTAIALYSNGHWIGGTIALVLLLIEAA